MYKGCYNSHHEVENAIASSLFVNNEINEVMKMEDTLLMEKLKKLDLTLINRTETSFTVLGNVWSYRCSGSYEHSYTFSMVEHNGNLLLMVKYD